MSSTVNRLKSDFECAPKLQPFPAVVTRLIECVNDVESSMDDVAKIVELDAAISVKLLQLVNSPLIGLGQTVDTIKHAINLLGPKRIKLVALTYAASRVVCFHDKETLDQRRSLWKHSVGCAAVARTLTSCVPGLQPDEAFTAGVFHDIGKLWFLQGAPAQYRKMLSTKHGQALLDEETETFGQTHESTGFKIMAAWPIADGIKAAVKYHHEPESDTKDTELARVVRLSDLVARFCGIGSKENHSIEFPAEMASDYFEISEQELSEIASESRTFYEESINEF